MTIWFAALLLVVWLILSLLGVSTLRTLGRDGISQDRFVESAYVLGTAALLVLWGLNHV